MWYDIWLNTTDDGLNNCLNGANKNHIFIFCCGTPLALLPCQKHLLLWACDLVEFFQCIAFFLSSWFPGLPKIVFDQCVFLLNKIIIWRFWLVYHSVLLVLLMLLLFDLTFCHVGSRPTKLCRVVCLIWLDQPWHTDKTLYTKKPFSYFMCMNNTINAALNLQGVNGWHDLDNTEYDCWPMNSPNDYNMINCGGKSASCIDLPVCVCFVCRCKWNCKIWCFPAPSWKGSETTFVQN